MNKAELKQLLKPLIKECIKEVIFEDGVLAGVVSEVTKGLGGTPLVEAAPQRAGENNFDKMRQQSLIEQTKKINSHRQELMKAMGDEAYNGVNLFEGTAPLTGATPKPGARPAAQGPLDGVAPTDSGVDISSLLGESSRNWKTLAGSGK